MRDRELKINSSGMEYMDRFSIYPKQNSTYSNIVWVLHDELELAGEFSSPLSVFKKIDQILQVDEVNRACSGAPDVILEAERGSKND